MSWADYLIVFTFLASAAFGVWRGFVKEALSIATWLIAIWLAWRFAWLAEPILGEWTAAPELKIWAARIVIFIIVMAVGGLLAWFVRTVVRASGLSSIDRSLGGVFGLVRGFLIVGLAVIALEFTGAQANPWWQDATLKPLSEQIAAGIRYYAELGGQYLSQQEFG